MTMGPLGEVFPLKTLTLISLCWVAGSWSAHVGLTGNDLIEDTLKSRSRFPEGGSQLTFKDEEDILAKLMPFVNFRCDGRQPGFYADRQFHCEVFHLCQPNGDMATRICPSKSRFNQVAGACEDETMVKCQKNDDVMTMATDASRDGQLRDQIPTMSTATSVGSITESAKRAPKRVARQAFYTGYTHRLIPRQTSFVQRQGVVPQGPALSQHSNFLFNLVPQQSAAGPLFLLPQQPQFFRFTLPPQDTRQFAPLAPGANNPRAVQIHVPENIVSAPVGASTGQNTVPLTQPIGSSSNANRLQVESQQSPLRQGQLLVQQPGNQQIPNRGHHNQQQFQQQPPPNHPSQFDPDFFIDDDPRNHNNPQPFFTPQRFNIQQDNRQPQNINNRPRNNGNQQQQGPPPFFGNGPPPQFNGPPFDEEDFFRPNFPHGGPPTDHHQRPPPQRPPTSNNQPNRLPQVGTNFIIRPEDSAIINGLHFPGPPQNQRDPPPSSLHGSSRPNQQQSSHSTGANQQRPSIQQTRPQSQQSFQNRPPQGHSGAASFPSRFPPQVNNGFNLPPDRQPHSFQGPFNQGPPNGFQQPLQQFPFAPLPPRRPSLAVTSQPLPPSTTTRSPTTHSPTTRPRPQIKDEDTVTPISSLHRPTERVPSSSSSSNRFNNQEREPPRPSSSTSSSNFNDNKRGQNKFHPEDGESGSDFNRPDHTRPTPTRRPPQSNFDPSPLSIPESSFGSDSAEAFGIPPPSNDFGTKLGPDGIGHDGIQHFDTPTQRNPPSSSPPSRRPSTQPRPRPTEQFFSASPPRTAAGSSPFHPETMFSHIMPPPPRPLQSSGEQFLPPTSQRSPPRHSTTEGSNTGGNKRPSQDFTTSTEFPEFFPTRHDFPDLNDNNEQFNLHDTTRPNQDFPEDLFSFPPPREPNFPSAGLQNGPFRGSFLPQHDVSVEHNNIPKEDGISTSSRPQGSDQNLNNFQQSSQFRPNDGRGTQNNFDTFSSAGRFPEGPTFGPQSNDQLAPPELPSFTARPDSSSGPQLSNFNGNPERPNSQHQQNKESLTDTPSSTENSKSHMIEEAATVSPTEITSTINEAPSSTKRGRRPVGVTNAGRNGLRTRPPQGGRTRTRRPSTEPPRQVIESTTFSDASSPAPRRRFRQRTTTSTESIRSSSSAPPRRRTPVPQRNSIKKTTSGLTHSSLISSKEHHDGLSQEAISGESVSSSSTVAPERRRPAANAVGKRIVSGRKGNSTRMVVRRRRPVSTSSSPSPPHSVSGNDISAGTVDHSSGFSREPIFSSSNGRKNVAVVAKFESGEDSAIAASQEQVTVTRAQAVVDHVSGDAGSIQDHSSSLVTQPEVFNTRSTVESTTTKTTTSTTTTTLVSVDPTESSYESKNDISVKEASTTETHQTETTPPTTTAESTVAEVHSTIETSTTKKSDDKPEALSKLRSLLSRKFVIKLTTDAPQRR